MAKTRRRFTSVEKAAIVRRHLVEKTPISDLCDEHRIQPTQVYTWQKQLLDNASQAFERPKRSSKQEQAREDRIEALEAQLRQKNEVVAQLLDEHFALKKQLGPNSFGLGPKRQIPGGLGDWSSITESDVSSFSWSNNHRPHSISR